MIDHRLLTGLPFNAGAVVGMGTKFSLARSCRELPAITGATTSSWDAAPPELLYLTVPVSSLLAPADNRL